MTTKLTMNGRFNRLHDELSDLFDAPQATGVHKFLTDRILQDVLEMQEEFLSLEKVAGNGPALKYELDLVKRERDELKQRLNKLLSGQLRERPELKNLNEYERGQFESVGKLDEFLLHISEKQLINAIKLYRSIFNGGLKESKDRVEEIMGGFR